MDPLRWESRPRLRRPVLIAAFEGWNDAGEAASLATRYLGGAWSVRRFALIDPEEFYDFTDNRPQIRMLEGLVRRVEWPANELAAGAVAGTDHDAIVLRGVEPQLRWRTFTDLVVDVAKQFRVELVVTLGALLAEVSHRSPVPVVGSAATAELGGRLGLPLPTYQGPTGIVGVLHPAMAEAGIASASLWASAPHYLAQTRSPKAALALVRRVAGLLAATVNTADLEAAAAQYERQVDEAVAGNQELSHYIEGLESATPEPDRPPAAGAGEQARLEPLAGESLAAEVARFLREQDRG
ncbi:MAG: PAC2 family protein [Acidimicrobiales bacterium]